MVALIVIAVIGIVLTIAGCITAINIKSAQWSSRD